MFVSTRVPISRILCREVLGRTNWRPQAQRSLHHRRPVDEQPLVVVAGSTGTGKSDLGITLAKTLNGEVISADSMQVYKGLDIATNKVTAQEMAGIPHHLLDFLGTNEPNYDAQNFRVDALRCIEAIRARGRMPIVVGGSQKFIEALLYTTPTESAVDNNGRRFLPESTAPTAEVLYALLEAVDPERAAQVFPYDSVQVLRQLDSHYRAADQMRVQPQRLQVPETGTEVDGSLRFKNTLFLYLEAGNMTNYEFGLRTRQEKMFQRGLLQELEAFYAAHKHELGPFGVMQTIALMVFLPYLGMDGRQRASEHGAKVLADCKWRFWQKDCEYARHQRRLFRERILHTGNREVPKSLILDITRDFRAHVEPTATKMAREFIFGATSKTTASEFLGMAVAEERMLNVQLC